MECGVGKPGRKQAGERSHAPSLALLCTLDHQARSPHAEDHPVPTGIEGQRCILHCLGRRCGPCHQEARTDPLHQCLARDIVRTDDDHPIAATQPDPVRGHPHRLGGACTGRIGLGIGPLSTDVLSKLRVPHAQYLEQEATLKAPLLIRAIVEQKLGKAVVAGEGAGKDHARVRLHAGRELPALRHLLALLGGVIGTHQRNSRIAQRLHTRGKGQLRGDVQSSNQARIYPVLLCQIEGSLDACKPDHAGALEDRLEGALTGLCILVEPDHILGQEPILDLV